MEFLRGNWSFSDETFKMENLIMDACAAREGQPSFTHLAFLPELRGKKRKKKSLSGGFAMNYSMAHKSFFPPFADIKKTLCVAQLFFMFICFSSLIQLKISLCHQIFQVKNPNL